jgi:hypothetical protein
MTEKVKEKPAEKRKLKKHTVADQFRPLADDVDKMIGASTRRTPDQGRDLRKSRGVVPVHWWKARLKALTWV